MIPSFIIRLNSALTTLNFSSAIRRRQLWTTGSVVAIWWVMEWRRIFWWKDSLVLFANNKKALCPDPNNLTFVSGSVRQCQLISRRPYLCKKSATNMSLSMSAFTNILVKTHPKPKFKVRHLWLNVWISDLIRAWRVNLWGLFCLSALVAGIIDICAPLSIKKRIPVALSNANNRRLILLLPAYCIPSSCKLKFFYCLSLNEWIGLQ